jgi:hypothetical protein
VEVPLKREPQAGSLVRASEGLSGPRLVTEPTFRHRILVALLPHERVLWCRRSPGRGVNRGQGGVSGSRRRSTRAILCRRMSSQAESVSSQVSSLRTGRSRTPQHIRGPGHVGRALDGRHACDS